MFEAVLLSAALVAVHIIFGSLRRRAERGTWSKPLVDNRPHEAPKKAG